MRLLLRRNQVRLLLQSRLLRTAAAAVAMALRTATTIAMTQPHTTTVVTTQADKMQPLVEPVAFRCASETNRNEV